MVETLVAQWTTLVASSKVIATQIKNVQATFSVPEVVGYSYRVA
jgi:hypothetical protein